MLSAALLTVISALVGLLSAGVWIGLSLIAVAAISLGVFRSLPIEKLLGQITWNTLTTPELAALPLFILMSEILFFTKLAAGLFKGLAPWTYWLPGRLLHVNVLGCTLFAAVSGSSAATTATVGRITIQELKQRGYNKELAIGSLAGAGTLGFLIPPSLIMIVYGVLAEASILKLFMAGILPGLVVAAFFMLFIAVRATLKPGMVPTDDRQPPGLTAFLVGLVDLGPVAGLIVAIIGSMYLGIATPTESAAFGVLGAVVISAAQGMLTIRNISGALLSTLRTTSMIALILMGAAFLSAAVGFLGIPQQVATLISHLGLSPWELILVLLLFYAILGCVLDGTSMIVMTLPITLPVILAAGFDKIWFGIFLVITVEMSQITPPVGFNLFVIQTLTGERLVSIALYAFPFFIILLLMVLLITAFPDIVLMLPRRLSATP